jgi:hypothetical protein
LRFMIDPPAAFSDLGSQAEGRMTLHGIQV